MSGVKTTRVQVAEAEQDASQDQSDGIRLMRPLLVLAKRKRLLILLPLGTGILTAIISLLLPVSYKATARIMPPQQSQSLSTTILGQIAPLGSVAGFAAKDLGLRNPSDLYIAMLRSDTVSNALIDRFSLMSVYKTKRRIDAQRRLDSSTEIAAGKEGVISVSVTDRDPARAAALGNAYIEELQKLTKTLAITEAGKRRLFFEQEVQGTSNELGKAEEALRHTQETTGIIQVDNQSKAMIDSLSTLQAQVVAKETQVRVMRGYATEENPELIRATRELSSLRTELAKLEAGQVGTSITDVPLRKIPASALEYFRRLREVKYRESLFEFLSKQYEAARIDEAKDAVIIQILDPARKPEERSWPHRSIIVLSTMFVMFAIAMILAFILEMVEQARAEPSFAAEWDLFRFYLRQKWLRR